MVEGARKRHARSHVACQRCHALKIKCDGRFPCARCQSFNFVCRNPLTPASEGSGATQHALARIERAIETLSERIDARQPFPPQQVLHGGEAEETDAGASPIAEFGSSSPLPSQAPILDPIAAGVVDEAKAALYVDFFLERCSKFLPLIDASPPRTWRQLRRSSAFLFSAVLAISAMYRGHHRHHQRENEVGDLATIAEAFLGRTMTRAHYCLGDVQAVILLHAWGLRPGHDGPDSWVLSGHAFRLAKRLTIDRTVTPGYNSPSAARRTWLLLCASDCFPSVGYGRPASPKENLDACAAVIATLREEIFSNRLSSEDSSLAAFLAAQGELAQVSRQLLDWVLQASVQHPPDQTTIWEQYRTILGRLEVCHDRWESPRFHNVDQRICSSLYRWHVHLCLDMFALKMSEASRGALLSATREVRESSYTQLDSIEAERYHEAYQTSACNAARAIIELHANNRAALEFVPDYLVTALAQAALTFLGMMANTQEAARLAVSALESLEHGGTGLAEFLSMKLRRAVVRAGIDLAPIGDPVATQETPPALLQVGGGEAVSAVADDSRAARQTSSVAMDMSGMPAFQNAQQAHGASPDNFQWSPSSSWNWSNSDRMVQLLDTQDPLRLLFGENYDYWWRQTPDSHD